MSILIEIETINKLHSLLGDEKPKHPLVTVIDFTGMKLKMPENDIRIRTDLYSIMIKKHLTGAFTYGRKPFDFEEGAVLCTAPGQIISYSSENGIMESEGITIYFHPDLISQYQLGKSITKYSFFNYEADEALHISDKEKSVLLSISEKITNEIDENIDDFTQDLIVSNIELLLGYIKRYYSRQFITRKHSNSDVLKRFEIFLNSYINSDRLRSQGLPSVQLCAQEVCYSPNYLSDLLRKETGKNTQEHIHEKLISRAKIELLGSDKTVTEIAYELGFEYAHYFTKLFKKHLGVTPSSYRKSQ